MRSSPLRESLSEHALITGGTSRLPSWPTLLIVDSDTETLQAVVCFFEKRGFHVAAAASLAEARVYFHRRKTWTLVLADAHLSDGSGFELCCWLRDQTSAPPPFLLMAGTPHTPALWPDVEVIAKPFPLEALAARIRTLVAPAPAGALGLPSA